MTLSDQELLHLLDDLESDRVERKESFKGDAPSKVREAVCAFANDLAGHRLPGIVVIGAKDDGRLCGIEVTDELLRTLSDIRSDGNILPIPTMLVEKREIDGSSLAVITVQPAIAPPVRYKGRTYIRTGPRRDIASAQDERILNERRRALDQPFDLQSVSQATIEDLSRTTFVDEYLPSAFSRDALDANERTYVERLSSCRMVSSIADPTPTVLGVLVLATRTLDLLPNAYVEFLRLDGIALHDAIVDSARIDGRIGEVISRLDDKMRAHVATAVDVSTADKETRQSDFPMSALQQLIRNAVMHRTYEQTHAPIRVTWFQDRIEILSPGGPFGIVNRDNFGMPGVTDYRNPNLAEAMKVLGYVQRFGVGIATASALLARNGNPPPAFDVQPNYVLVTLRKGS